MIAWESAKHDLFNANTCAIAPPLVPAQFPLVLDSGLVSGIARAVSKRESEGGAITCFLSPLPIIPTRGGGRSFSDSWPTSGTLVRYREDKHGPDLKPNSQMADS